ncbi:MAG: DNA translocase FtsK 4TM domain-containing protein [Bryobacteraceae bacterium]
MKLISPTQHKRLNEVVGLLLLSLGLLLWLGLVSYHAEDPSWNSATGEVRPLNLIGYPGAYASDLCYQIFGLVSFAFPVLLFLLGWKWVRSENVEAPVAKVIGSLLFVASATAVFSLTPEWRLFNGTVSLGGLAGRLAAGYLRETLNLTGAVITTVTALLVSIYLISTFTVSKLRQWFDRPIRWWQKIGARWQVWLAGRRRLAQERAERRAQQRAARRAARDPEVAVEAETEPPRASRRRAAAEPAPTPEDAPPFDLDEIPICPLEELPAERLEREPAEKPAPARNAKTSRPSTAYQTPPTDLLNEPPGRSAFDEQELKDTAARIKAKFEEFNVLGSVVQINPGPVVTTFEFKPEAGIKYSRITTLTEDLCLGLHAESILIERIPGKPTVGIEVPNSKREVISLRQVLESEDFINSPSHLTISLGKDINGRIKVASLDSMPHLLIAGSTGSGKSVMVNSMIMSILYKSTPEEVRLIMVDPKRLELGLYEGIPHLLTPVITDPKKATYALKNAVLEMERRLRLMAEQGVRNIDQYNKKIRKLREAPLNLFQEEGEAPQEELQTLPFILILIDELADLMMLEGRNVEESVTRLAQMARAVGMHLVLATQRPSVDVITGLIKANFPARISFRVATRVDSRTILDVMGSEHLLGRGDMLFLPPGSSRLTRVHGAFVTETEINRVVEFWKRQAAPEYDQSFLLAPPADDGGEAEGEAPADGQDPMYEEALRVVLEMGKASTSTLQRRLRLGYGRAARILDTMYRDGIIGPPDGSKPREVLKRPDWLREVEDQVR